MDKEVIKNEIKVNGNRKINIGVKVHPSLKNKLSEESNDLGIPLSEHVESILHNKDTIRSEKENYRKKAEALEEENLEKDAIIKECMSYSPKFIALTSELEKAQTENRDSKRKIAFLEEQQLLKDEKDRLKLVKEKEIQTETINIKDADNSIESLFDELF